MPLTYRVRVFFFFTLSLDSSQQNQVWPLTSVSDPQREKEMHVECRGSIMEH